MSHRWTSFAGRLRPILGPRQGLGGQESSIRLAHARGSVGAVPEFHRLVRERQEPAQAEIVLKNLSLSVDISFSMQSRVESASVFLTFARQIFWRLALFAFFALRVLGQSNQAIAPLPALSSPDSPQKAQPSAAMAMQESILRQKQALLAGQQRAQQGSLAQQRGSLRLQHQDAIPSVPRAPLGTAESTLGSFSDDFFSTRWEPNPPAAMPNVRIPTTACPALADEEVDKLTKLAADKNAIPAALIRAVMKQESAFHPCAVSTAGAMGLMQIMPGTAETLGLEDAFSPGDNVEAGARYLKQLLDRYHGDRRLALGAYNAGPGRVDNTGGIPDIPETIDYVSRILGDLPDEETATSPAETPQAPATGQSPPTPQLPKTPDAAAAAQTPATSQAPATPVASPAAPPVPSDSPSTAPAPPPAP